MVETGGVLFVSELGFSWAPPPSFAVPPRRAGAQPGRVQKYLGKTVRFGVLAGLRSRW